jgi:TPR repeat protein
MKAWPLPSGLRRPSLAAGAAFLLAALVLAFQPSAAFAAEIDWIIRAAQNGDADAQFTLGVMYDNGDEVRQSHREAFKWYLRAAKQGHVKAQYNLAVSYDNGEGTNIDHSEANLWYRRAAEQGHVNSMVNLALSYIKGEGVRRDRLEAVKWLVRAADRGSKKADDLLYELVDY